MIPKNKMKGDIGTIQVMADLVKKGYIIFVPATCESLPFDLIAYKDGESVRIQCKYSAMGYVKDGTSWADRNGNHKRKYQNNDFDYYGIYLPDIDKVVYPSIKLMGIQIATKVRNSVTPFYWWEDFQNFTDVASKKTYKDFGIDITRTRTDKMIEASFESRKVCRPTKEELEKLLWEIPTQKLAERFGVSDVAIAKWAKAYKIKKPPRGYWSKTKQ